MSLVVYFFWNTVYIQGNELRTLLTEMKALSLW